MDSKTVLVTGIGGNVGQGVLRNITSLGLPIRIIGCDIASFSPGNHLCDRTYQVPYSYDDKYIPTVQDIIESEMVDMIIPTTDYEVFYLASNKQDLNTFILASNSDLTKIFLDKYLTFKTFKQNNIPFAQSWLPQEYDFSQDNFIAKPREGRGSRGILVNPEDIRSLGDDYMIQPLHKGNEFTTAIYVNKKGDLHGIFTLERTLENGTTTLAIVNDSYNHKFLEIAKKIIALGKVRGSINLQSIVDDNGNIFPFEVNCRISGSNSIRHCLGFQDVKYAIQEYLYNTEPDEVQAKKGVATRILIDVIYPDASDFDSLNNNSSDHILY